PAVPFGTRVWIPGYGPGVVVDRGGAVRGLHLDVYLADLAEARSWGVRVLRVRFYGLDPGVLAELGGG
ncbi:MAG: 3D domain-containing protein, partial [Bacillota bacterium]